MKHRWPEPGGAENGAGLAREREGGGAGERDPSVLFRALFMHMAEGVALHEITAGGPGRPPGYRIVEVNPQYERFMGLPRERLVGKLATEVFGPDDPRRLDIYGQPIREDRPARLETHCPYTDRHFDVSVSPMGSGFFATIMVDVTEHKLQEKALREGEWFLQRSQRVGRLGSYRLDVASGVWVSSQGLDDVFGIDATFSRDVAGWLTLVHPGDREAMGRYFAEEVLGKGRAFDRRYRIIRRSDGEERWVHGRGELERDPGGALVSMIGTIQDITESVQREQQLLQSQKMESVGLLAGGVAHDFNNILTVILGCTDEVAQRVGPSRELEASLAEITQAAQRAAELTRQLLAFSRRQVLQPRALDLNNVVADLSRMLRRMLGETVRLELVLGDDVEAVFADPGQLQQIIVNLAVNARDAMPDGGTLTFQTANLTHAGLAEADAGLADLAPGSYVALIVRDTGLGMDEATRARIFEPFFTTKGEMGTGLGLATVYGIVKQSGGQILVSSRPGSGTTFQVLLPRAEPGSAGLAPTSHRARSLPGRETVLLVEDEAMVRAVLKKVLIGAGYSVLEAANAEDASLVNGRFEGTIHALVTDVVMPGKTGLELVRQLTPLRPSLKVLYMSGYAPSAAQLPSRFDGGAAFLQKPITPPQLLAALRDVLDAG
jgi:PAS domain S-box-containing protein